MITAKDALWIAKNNKRYNIELVLLENDIREHAELGYTCNKLRGNILTITQNYFESLGFRFTIECDGKYIMWGETK